MQKELTIFYEKNVKNMFEYLKLDFEQPVVCIRYTIARVSNIKMNSSSINVQTNEADYVIHRTLRSLNVIP